VADDALVLLVILNRWQISASERKVQLRRTFVLVCSPKRTFFTLKFGELLVGCSHEMLSRCLSNRCALNHVASPLKALRLRQQRSGRHGRIGFAPDEGSR
jgi:hypothetical protein